MKKILMTMVALLSMTVMMAQTGNGDNKAPKKMTHEEMTTQMSSKLKLTDAQKTKVAALNKEYQDYMMPAPPQQNEGQKSAKGSKTEQKKPSNKDQSKRQEYEKKLKKILTADQYKAYQKMGPQCNDSKGKKDKQRKTKKK